MDSSNELLEQKKTEITNKNYAQDAAVLSSIVDQLQKLDEKGQKRILKAIFALLGFEEGELVNKTNKIHSMVSSGFSEDRNLTAKEFLLQKSPKTDIERIACLAYYLTHYKDTPHFKTIDLSNLNMEAAQMKFSNAAVAVDNATWNAGFLTQTTHGNKQITALGELYVQALPDRDAAKAAISSFRKRKRSKKQIIES